MRTPFVTLALAAASLPLSSLAYAQTAPRCAVAPTLVRRAPGVAPAPPSRAPPPPPAPPPPAHASSDAGSSRRSTHLRETGILSRRRVRARACATSEPRRGASTPPSATVGARQVGDDHLRVRRGRLHLRLDAELRPISPATRRCSAPSGQHGASHHAPACAAAQLSRRGRRGSHGQLQFGVRNSRFGLRFRAPGYGAACARARCSRSTSSATSRRRRQPGGVLHEPDDARPPRFLPHRDAGGRRARRAVLAPLRLAGRATSRTRRRSQGLPGELYARAPAGPRVEDGEDAGRQRSRSPWPPCVRPSLSEVARGRGRPALRHQQWTGMHTAGATGTSLTPASIAVTETCGTSRSPRPRACSPPR